MGERLPSLCRAVRQQGAISVTCVPVDPKNPDAALKDKMDAWRKQGVTVARVNWKYAGG